MMRALVMSAVLALIPAAHAAPPRKVAAHTPVARDWTRTIVATPEGGVRMGNPAAKVAVIEYGSRTCPHCAHFAAEGLPALKAGYIAGGKVSYEFRDFPVHDALDFGPILLGRCSGVARFFPLLDGMMAAQPKLLGNAEAVINELQGKLAAASPNAIVAGYADGLGYTAFVEQRGVSAVRARACLADRKALDAVVARTNAAQRDWKISSTPTFIVNGKPAAGNEWSTLEPLLRAALAP